MVLSIEYGVDFDRSGELRAFDDSKAGVKGLVDAGLERVPLIFNQAWAGLDDRNMDKKPNASTPCIPFIDLQGIYMGPAERSAVVREVQEASKTWGFFHVINHGIPGIVLDEMIQGIRRFHEQETEQKKAFYTRDRTKRVCYNSNFNLFSSTTANWRDTFYVYTASDPSVCDELPEVCRHIVTEYTIQLRQLRYTLLELISEALGLKPSHLKELQCAEDMIILGQYYPSCPEPELTMGSAMHTDKDLLTILLQDQVGGLQVLHNHQWVDVRPLRGALIVNCGDILQVLSNNKFISVSHRVLSNREGPRIAVATFIRPHATMIGNASATFGPIPELISEITPPVCKDLNIKGYSSVRGSTEPLL